MSERVLKLMDIRTLIMHLRAGSTYRQIQRDTGHDRRTIKRYKLWAQEQGLLDGELPALEVLQGLVAGSFQEKTPPQNQSSVAVYGSLIEQCLKARVEVAAIHQRLIERGYKGSYASVWRFVRTLQPGAGEDRVVRVETRPGEEAQVDFGYGGRMLDPATGQLRKTWAFVMVLSWSRHMYVEFVWDQKVTTWLSCHRNALEFFRGVPGRVRIDNLKAAILKAVFDDPQVQYAYQECALHYGFLIAPCRVATPEHKGKVEQGGVHYVCRNFLGGRQATSLAQANREVSVWCNTTAGLRRHGTTKEKPFERFQQVEQSQLKPLPASPYEIAVWKQVKVYRDCYVSFDQAFYSVPYRLYPGKVWICGGSRQVRIFDSSYQFVASHDRAQKAGQRLTNRDHLPPEKRPGVEQDGDHVLAEAEAIGPGLLQIVQGLLDDPVLYRLPTAGRLVRLKHRFGDNRLEAACQRALLFDDPSYKTVKSILEQGLDQKEAPVPLALPPAHTYARPAEELVGGLAEVPAWS